MEASVWLDFHPGECVALTLLRKVDRIMPASRRPSLIYCFAALLFVGIATPVSAQEEESPSDSRPTSVAGDSWIIDPEITRLKLISPRTGFGSGRVYWYLVYSLRNKTGEDREIYVNVTATTDNKRHYSDMYLPNVELAAERKEGRSLWGKTDENRELAKRDPKSPVYQYFPLGADQQRECIAVFNRFDPAATRVRVRLAGLSNDIRVETRDDGTEVIVSRVYEVTFHRVGDEFEILKDKFDRQRATWTKVETPLTAVARDSK